MTRLVGRLWTGQVPLAEAFWRYTVVYGLLLNVIAHGLFLVLLLRDANPVPVAIAFALPAPYNLFMIVAVWRSAGRYPGPKSWVDLARLGTVVLMAVLTVM